MSPAAQRIIDRLDATRQGWWLFTLLCTMVLALSTSLTVALAMVLADSIFTLSQGPLAVMLLTWLTLTVAMMLLAFRRLMRSQRSLEATARCIETEYPELGSNLINVLQLSEDTENTARHFCDAAVVQSVSKIGGLRFERAAHLETRWRRFRYCMQTPRDFGESLGLLGFLVGIAILLHLFLPNWGSAATRLMTPWKFVPTVGKIQILVEPGDTEVLVGSSLRITAEINDLAKETPFKATLFLSEHGKDETGLAMEAGEPFAAIEDGNGSKQGEPRRKYTLTLPSVVKPLQYRIEVGDSQSPMFNVSVLQKPTIEEVEVTYRFPAYLGRDPETLVQRTADLEAPQFTIAELAIRSSAPITRGHIAYEGGEATGEVRDEGRLLFVRFPLLKNTTFTIHLGAGDFEDSNPRLNRVRVLPDGPPTIELLKPARKGTAAPGDDIAVTIRAGDDCGLGRVRLEAKVNDTEAATESEDADISPEDKRSATELRQWTEFSSSRTAVLHHRLELTDDLVHAGQTLLIRAVAWDSRDFRGWGQDLRPQETASGWHVIRIIDKQTEVDQTVAELDDLRAALFKLFEKQIKAQKETALVAHRAAPEQKAATCRTVRALQIDIQKSSISLVKSIDNTDREERLITKRILNELAFGDMLTAVGQCDAMIKIEAVEAFESPAQELYETQGRILEVLSKLLNVMRRAQTEELAEMEDRQVGDLPDDAKQKMEDLQNALEEALEQQKKVVEASENLAKAPVEDFSEEEEQLVQQLEAAEDAWAKFMKELNTDMSKLPEQDLANPSLLEELVEIQTEIKMAEDALLAKSNDIAVPLEQLGAEMAEELVTNMEKWLPDEPDRSRWSQEESLTDEGKEAPMAELPGELEDLIGDLLEEEEDLFDEMEDVSSSAADSLDKGAGWDASDGPISDMSAKGVTGNRLPNTSEIGGRAGEGRQGKSSGEFVGEEAVGKGGRMTPSRLTPDPYVAGQIKDHSKDPVGGATGGGKESGEGGEGLEGPAPGFRGQRDTNRLAGRQADLRNKAEGIDLQHFKVMGYHHTDLERMIDLMAQIERDLKAGRYQNALRQRKVLAEGLGNVKQHLEGEFEVRQDATVNMPSDIQEDILGSMQDPSPVGWEQLNRDYFERLSGSDGDMTGAE